MKKLIWVIFASLAMLSCGSAYADSITAVGTGDDNLSYWDAGSSSWQALGTNWQVSSTGTLNINLPSQDIYFAVSNNNWYPGGNPAGFLASFTDTNGTFVQTGTNTLLTNTSIWQVLPSATPFNGNLPGPTSLSNINPTVDPTTLSGWLTPTAYGTNAGPSIWTSANGGPVSGISPDAQWIWTANNDGTYGTQDDYVYFRVDLGVIPTPEASTLLLFAMGAALLVFLMRRKMLKVA